VMLHCTIMTSRLQYTQGSHAETGVPPPHSPA
jgi:hypothetical protein